MFNSTPNSSIDQPRNIVKVVTTAGYSFEGDANDVLFALGSDGDPKPTRFCDLTTEHYIGIQRGAEAWGNDDDVSEFKNPRRKRPSIRSKDCDLSMMTVDLAYMMGLLLGDGFVNYKAGNISVAHAQDETQMIEFLSSSPCGLRFSHPKNQNQSVACNAQFASFLQWYGFMPGVKAPAKTIPCRLFSATRQTAAAFLSGLFDADGTTAKRDGRVSLTSTSRVLVEQVQLLLLNMGMISRYYRSITPPNKRVPVSSVAYNLELSSYNSRMFYDQIGFRLDRKQKRRENLPVENSAMSRSRDGVPYQQSRLARVRKGAWFSQNVTYNIDMVQKQKMVGYTKLREFVERCSDTTERADLAVLQRFLDEDRFYDRVKLIC